MAKLSIIIPVYNEKETILKLLDKVNQVDLGNIEKEIIIVDDFSTDGTREILRSAENQYKAPLFGGSGIKIIYHDKNYGKGRAVRSGIKQVTGDWVIIQDADLEYEPNDIKKVLNKMIQKNAQVVYGSRRLNGEYLRGRYSGISFAIGGIFVSWIANLLYQIHITDEPTCYKMIKTDLLKSLNLQCERFEFCPEVTAKVAKRKIKIYEVPINYYPRHKNEGKKINWYDGLEAIWTLIKYRF